MTERAAVPANANLSLEERMAAFVSDIWDAVLVTVPGASFDGPQPLELRLAHFRPDLSERAAELLEEAGL